MKIVHIITRLLRAGSEENTLLTCAGQIAEGHEVHILHGSDVNAEFALGMAPGVRLLEIPALVRELSPANDGRAYLQIRSALRNLRPDVVHTHQSKAGIVGRLAAASLGVRAVIHGVHILPFLEETGAKRAIYLNAEKLTARSTDAFIHVSDGMMSSCSEYGVGTGKIHRIVHSGFEIDRFATARPPGDWRGLLGVDDGAEKPPVIAMLAALEERKQHLALVECIPQILENQPEAHFVFAGEGHLRERLTQKIAAMGLEGRVHVLGYRSDPERIIALADLCLLCSRREGLPRSVMQYLSGGKPPVVFHVEGIERLVADGENGIVLRQGDWSGLTLAISDLLRNTPRLERMSRKARETDLSEWDASLMAGKTLAVYEEVLGMPERVRRATHRGEGVA